MQVSGSVCRSEQSYIIIALRSRLKTQISDWGEGGRRAFGNDDVLENADNGSADNLEQYI